MNTSATAFSRRKLNITILVMNSPKVKVIHRFLLYNITTSAKTSDVCENVRRLRPPRKRLRPRRNRKRLRKRQTSAAQPQTFTALFLSNGYAAPALISAFYD